MLQNYFIVGLGNHGAQYKKNRHNIGYIVLDSICKNLNLGEFKQEKSYSCSLITTRIDSNKFFFIKPETYMNNSGITIQQLKRFYKIENQNIIVLYDEIDLGIGKCKIAVNGGDNGHNGIKSIDALCGKDYYRLKIGVGRSENPYLPVADYVLSDLSQQEILHSDEVGKTIAGSINCLFGERERSILLNKLSKLKMNEC